MNNALEKLMKDDVYFTDLINGPCKATGFEDDATDIPVNGNWIDDAASEAVSTVYRNLLPADTPFFSFVKVIRDPETVYNGAAVSDDKHRLRYVIVNLLPDCSFPYDFNYAIIHSMSVFALSSWEISRASLEASKQWAQVMIRTEPGQFLLNSARIQWVSVFVGKKPFSGTTKLSQHRGISVPDGNEVIELDTHFVNAREMDDPVIKELLDAIDDSSETQAKP